MDLDHLSYELIDEQPQPYEFLTSPWELLLPLTDEEIETERCMPLIDRVYPLGERFCVPSDFRRRLHNMTVVSVWDKPYLALTGCGMDFTWEICETYVSLGYYPPVTVTALPAMAGRGESASDRAVAQACMRSLDAMLDRYQRRYDWLKREYGVSERER